MKKVLALLMALSLATFAFGCKKPDDGKYTVFMPDGAPALSMAVAMHGDEKIGGEEFQFNVVNASTIQTYVASKEADFAIIPTNAAVNLYNNSNAEYKMISVNTYGNLYINVSGATSLEDLKGKVVACIGRGQVPSLVFIACLNKAEIEYEERETAVEGKVAIRYVQDGPGAIALRNAGQADAAVLGEPAATGSVNNISGSSLLNLQEIYGSLFDGVQGFPQACLIVRNGVPDAVIEALLEKLETNAEWCATNPADALKAVKDHMYKDTAPSLNALNATIVGRCNLVLKRASEVKDEVNTFMTALGVTPPNDGFYYEAEPTGQE